MPRATITSASLTNLEATGFPLGPIWPAFNLWLNGMASPWPALVTIGIFNNSANLITSLYLEVHFIPPPAMITDLFDWAIILADFLMSFFLAFWKLSEL